MTLEEMKKHEWVISWSGGKDSTATIILCHEYGIPIKKIVYVRMMYDENLPATLPVMTDFVDKTKEVFENWGYPVEIVKGKQTAMDIARKVYFKSVNEHKNGNYYGVSQFIRGTCYFQRVKPATIKMLQNEKEYELIGYASDEVERIGRLTDTKQSILLTLEVKEVDTFDICRKYNLLSPLYDLGIKRDGCWFCPNAGVRERAYLRTNYPELVKKIDDMIEMCNFDLSGLKGRNNWLKDYYENKECNNQISMFDFLEV